MLIKQTKVKYLLNQSTFVLYFSFQQTRIIILCQCSYIGNAAKMGDHYSYNNRIYIFKMQNEYIEIRKTKTMGRGMFAKRDIPTSTNILTIQENNFHTYSQIKQHPIFSRVEEDIESKLSCFAFYLSYCENVPDPVGDELTLKSYIKDLPNYYHNLICWNDEQLQILDNAFLVKKIKNYQLEYLEKFQNIKLAFIKMMEKIQTMNQLQTYCQSKRSTRIRTTKPIKHNEFISKTQMDILQNITYSQFLKHIAAIKSRNIYWAHQHDLQSEVGALIPYLEFFNHSQFSQCEVTQRSGSVSVITIKPIRKGEEVFVNYGNNFSLDQFLEDYGMIPIEMKNHFIQQKDDKENQLTSDEDEDSDANDKRLKTISEERIELAKMYKIMKLKREIGPAISKLPFSLKN